MKESGFLGSGLKFPVQADPGTGRFVMSHGADSVKEALYIILMTSTGERLMSPEFGSGLLSYTFMETSATMLNIMKNELKAVILKQEPRISEVGIDMDAVSSPGCLYIHISYKLAQTNTWDNFVFPFYLQTVKEDMMGGGGAVGER